MTPLVSHATILLARRLPLTVLVLTPPTTLHGSHQRALPARATARGHRVMTTPGAHKPRWLAWAGWATVPLGQATVLGLRLESWLSTVRRFSIFNFHLIFQKFV
jgi:hypothetical protein